MAEGFFTLPFLLDSLSVKGLVRQSDMAVVCGAWFTGTVRSRCQLGNGRTTESIPTQLPTKTRTATGIVNSCCFFLGACWMVDAVEMARGVSTDGQRVIY